MLLLIIFQLIAASSFSCDIDESVIRAHPVLHTNKDKASDCIRCSIVCFSEMAVLFDIQIMASNCTVSFAKISFCPQGKHSLFSFANSVASIMYCLMIHRVVEAPPCFFLRDTHAFLANVSTIPGNAMTIVSPLVSALALPASASCSSLELSASTFSSLRLASAPFLSAPFVSSVCVLSSAFTNISSNSQLHKSACSACTQTSFVQSCTFSGVDDVFDGGIIQSVNAPSHSTFSHNNTLSRCIRTSNTNYTNQKQMDQITLEPGEHFFSDCEWHNTFSEVDGGAVSLFDSVESSLTISLCLFDNCTSNSRGGALFDNNTACLKVNLSIFSNCTGGLGGAMYFGAILNHLYLSFNNFSNCLSIEGIGGGISWRYASENLKLENEEESSGSMIYNIIISNCTSKSTIGGGLSIYEPIFEVPELRECGFLNCSSWRDGGGLYFNVHELTLENATLLFYCLFVNNTSPNGDDVYFVDYHSRLQQNPTHGCASLTKSSTRLVIYNDQLHTHPEWLDDAKRVYADGAKGNDKSASCGVSEGNPCRTVTHAFTMLLRCESSSIILMSSVFDSEPDTIDVGASSMLVNGVERENTVLSSAPLPSLHPLFAVSTGSLTASNFTVVHDPSKSDSILFSLNSTGMIALDSVSVKRSASSSSALFSAPLLCCKSGGTATISNTDMAGFSFSACSAISSDHSNLTCVNCSLSNMKSEQDSGAGIKASVSSPNTFASKNTTFVGCACSMGSGGGIAIFEQGGGKIRIEGTAGCTTFSACTVPKSDTSKGKGGGIFIHTKERVCDACLSRISFAGCDGWKGKCVFYDAAELSAVVKSTTLDFDMDGMNDDDLMGFEAGFQTQPVPLKAYLLQLDGYGCVGGTNSRDFKGCGASAYPCETISWTVELKFSSKKRAIQLHDSFRWTEHIAMDQREWDVRCKEKGGTIHVDLSQNQKATNMIESKNLVSLSNMDFLAASPIGGTIECLILCADSILTITDCSLKTESGSIGTPFAKVAKGKLYLVSFKIASESIDASHVIVVSGDNSKAFVQSSEFKGLSSTGKFGLFDVCMRGTVEMENSTITSCKMKNSAMVGDEEGSILIASNVTFSAIERREGDGSCIHCSCLGRQASASTFKKCLFENCAVKEAGSGGGALKCCLDTGATLLIDECQFGNCSAPSTDTVGHGGGIFVDLHAADIAFKISSPLFMASAPNSAYYGADVFIQSPNLTTSITKLTIPFAHSTSTGNADSLRGFDGEDKTNAIPLIYFISDVGSIVHADSSNGLDVAPCGFTDYPCQTLSHSLTKQMAKAKNIGLSDSFELCEELALSDQHGIHISGVNSCSLFVVVEANSSQPGVITMSDNCPTAMMEFIRFRLPSKLQAHSSFACQNSQGELVLQDSIFETLDEAPPLSYNLISALSGSITISTVTAANIPLLDASFLVAAGFASVLLDSTSLAGVTTTSQHGLIFLSSQNASLLIEDSNLLSQHASQDFSFIFSDNANAIGISNTSMKGFAKNMKNGSAICCTVHDQQSLRIIGSTFESCSAEGGYGGGIYVQEHKGGKVTIGNTTDSPTMFAKCTSTEIDSSGGLGSGIYLHMTDSSAGVAMSSISFVECDAARGGSCVFVEAINLSSAITSELLGFEFEKSNNSSFSELAGFEGGNTTFVIPLVLFLRNFSSPAFVSNSGIDYRMCGYKDYSCNSISYAGAARYGSAKGKVRLAIDFEFADHIAFVRQEMEIDAEDNSAELLVRSDGLGEGSGLIEVSVDVSFTGISFNIPLDFSVNRDCLLLGSGSVLSVADCTAKAIGSGVSYSIACCTSGKLVLSNFTILSVEFAMAAAIKVSGREAKGEFVCLSIYGAKTGGISGLIVADNGGAIGLKGSLINCTTTIFMNHSMIFLGETSSSLTATNSSFIGATRRNGNGGAISGTICNEAVCAVSECNFSSNACIDSHSRGGSIIVSVKKGGKFLFDSNEVMNSKVDAENGFGGGLHLSFEDLEVNYSMIAISFSGNQAHLGSDVFLICPSPRIMIDKNKWAGSAQPGDDYLKTMWVINDESDPTISVSMLKYLFVSNDEIVFVDREESSNTAGCGNSNNPCQELAFGFSQMSSAKTTLSILKSADLSQPVHCEGEPLTICGVEEVNSVLKVMNHGCVTLLKGSQAAYLSVSSLNITLQTTAEQCPHDAFIEAAVGKVYFVSCIFGDPEGIEKRCCVWIAKGNGCSISFGNVLVAKLLFQSSCGLAFIRSGSLSIDKSSVDTVSTPSDSLVVCINEADSIINSTNVTACKTSQGSFYKVAGSGSNVVSGHCMLSVCTSANGNGGAVGCELSENGQFTINGAEIACCAVNKDSGRGGGIFMRLNDPHGTFLLEAIDFNQNNGYEGRDMFVGCKSLNQSIDPSNIKVPFYNSESIEIVDIKGKDRTHFSDSVDLAMFLYQRQASRVYVSKSGYDMIGCGAEEYPCFSFKRGSMNINELSFEKELLIDAETYIQEPVDVSSFLISSSASSKANISLRPEIIGNTRNAVLEATQQLTATFISFHFPSSFSSNVDCLIFASDIRFRIINSSFVQSGADPLSFALIRAAGGSVEMNSCNVSAITARFAPFVISSKLDLVDAQFSQIKAPESLRGGAFDVCLAEDYTVSLKTSNLSFCECSRNEGKGGFLYLDCTMSTASQPLKIDTITASSNIAHIGKNIYLESKNLNESVTLASFAFDYYEIMNDANAFAGHDPIIGDADLFMFVVEYKSSKIYVAYAGFDVRRCGSEFEPCRTAWAGIQHLTEESQSPQLLITKKTTIQDAHDVSGFILEGYSSTSEAENHTLLFSKKDQGESDPFLLNSRYLTIKNLLVSVSSGFENSKGGVIVNENGTVEAFQSGFSSEATIGTESHCSFLLMQQGFLRVSQFVVSSCNVGKNIFAVSNNSECTFNEMAISNVNITEACICLANSSSMASINKAVGCVITMGNSSFAGVSRSDNDSCIMESASEGGIVQIRNCSFRECRSRDSERGGVAFLNLGEYSSFAFLSSSIIQSFCSEEYGKGGGTYLLFGGVGDLNFLFQNSTFSGNSAFIGRDVFIECFSLSSQINESQFRMDLRESEYHRSNAIYGIDKTDHASTPFDLMELITMFQNDRIVVSSNFEAGGENSKQCGKINFPCLSIDYGLKHVTYDLLTQVLIDISSSLEAEITLDGISVMSLSKNICDVTVNLINRGESSYVITTNLQSSVSDIRFLLSSSLLNFCFSFIFVENGFLDIDNCALAPASSDFGGQRIASDKQLLGAHIIVVENGMLHVNHLEINSFSCSKSMIVLGKSENNSILTGLCVNDIDISDASVIDIYQRNSEDKKNTLIGNVTLSASLFKNIVSSASSDSCIISCSDIPQLYAQNSTICNCSMPDGGRIMKCEKCQHFYLGSCLIDGGYERNKTNDNEHNENYICYWNASLASIVNCSAEIKDSTFANSIKGGVAIFGGNVSIIEGKFEDNDPQIFRYPSIRRNIFCSGNGVLNIESLKGGDGLLPNSSLWILNDGCELLGVPSERLSPFFIPTLEKVESERSAEEISFTMKGTLLLPCNLSFQLIATIDETDSIATYQFCDDGFVSEEEVHSAIDISEIPFIPETAEVSIRILFGSREIPKQTDAFILKNRSESQPIENGNLSKSENEQKSSWTLIVIVMAVVLLLVLIILVIFIVRWRKAKNRTEELEEIVNDNIKKDPKAFEMVTMEMSPEEQWKRDEREAEKKNEEKIKRRVYDTNMEHSESSEHLLSESGSTEYILGRDSDKIPEWMLEKVDEKEEESRKRTPSPSISSTSTTDSDSTFVRGEDLCPTTSSMSNLVDAMACSSPHEKLIVDLRDSLFMLLHGLNKTKEMPIGTLQEREQTAAQILFWVANLALHSFDEMENELSSLADLSPHIVLFSEHMVICIVMHSDFSSDDSDLSSISSSTIITSSSDISVMSERFTDSPPPSSAFEDENDFKKECMRWKAPELLINKKMGATKESVSFSIGMMLWECLSLQIPFGEYEAETAGQKIKDGQRPNETLINGTSFEATVKRGLSQKAEERPTLIQLKREFIQHFPAGATVLTMSDAIDINESRTAEQSATMQNDDHSF